MNKQEPLTESYFYILLCLYLGPNHGYGIMQMAAELSEGAVKIGSGTMYGATSNMMKKHWIVETIGIIPEDSRKRLYELTDTGRDILENEIMRLRYLLNSAERVKNQLAEPCFDDAIPYRDESISLEERREPR